LPSFVILVVTVNDVRRGMMLMLNRALQIGGREFEIEADEEG
jgi:hypothetical protein